MTSEPIDEPPALQEARRGQRLLDRISAGMAAVFSAMIIALATQPTFYYMKVFFIMGVYWIGIIAFWLFQSMVRARMFYPYPTAQRTKFDASSRMTIVMTFLMMVCVSGLVAWQIPMRVSFLAVKPAFDKALALHQEAPDRVLDSGINSGIFSIGSVTQRCHVSDRVYFVLRHDSEGAFVYSESGVDDLCYNSGTKGRLTGNWFWIAED